MARAVQHYLPQLNQPCQGFGGILLTNDCTGYFCFHHHSGLELLRRKMLDLFGRNKSVLPFRLLWVIALPLVLSLS